MSIFNYYPYLNYNANKSTHLLLKVEVVKEYLKDFRKFFTYTIKEGERPDIIAYKQYEDSSLDWIIYLINNVQDPYYDWIMDDKQFVLYLEKKYNTTADKLQSTVIPSSIAYYYYEGLPSDDADTIASYNYTMSKETYDHKLSANVISVAGWSPVTIYEYERTINDSKREIVLLKPAYISEFKQQFKDVINSNV